MLGKNDMIKPDFHNYVVTNVLKFVKLGLVTFYFVEILKYEIDQSV